MGLKKKKNIIILTLCMGISFMLYQLHFFWTIVSEGNNMKLIPVMDHKKAKTLVHLRSEADKFINENGVIHGVLYAHMPKYRPNGENEFTCFKIDQRIPFEQVNDDYCDCEDGTDEPSTNACSNGTFYCTTQHHKPVSFNTVPSGQVNDGICDCCDGSDEWLHAPNEILVSQSNNKHYTYFVTKCLNTCN